MKEASCHLPCVKFLSVCPYIDVIEFATFAYKPQGDGSRGVFDWRLSYHSIPLRPSDRKNAWDLYENPVMVGGLFAISAKFFWELGGYDPGLDIWGGKIAFFLNYGNRVLMFTPSTR